MTARDSGIGAAGGSLSRRARRFLRRFMTRGGGVAMIFGLSFIPLSLLTLTAVDFHRASTVKNTLQDALDAAALAAARSQSTDAEEIQAIGMRVLAANMKAFHDTSITTASFTLKSDGTVVGVANAAVDPLVANMFLGGPLDVGAKAEVVRANDKLEVVLVLDNTGSMAGAKIATLRSAATDLVEQLEAGAGSGADALKVGLVPFSMTVRVGEDYQNANWIDNSARSSLHDLVFDGAGNRFAMLNAMGLDWAGCVESRPYPYDVEETPPTASDPDSLYVPFFAPDEPDTDVYPAFDNYWADNDYLPDGMTKKSSGYGNWRKHQGRKQKYTHGGLDTSNGKGPNRGCTLQPIARLTSDTSAIKTAIAGMVATGETNIPMGLMWGWHLLSPYKPFQDGAAYDDEEVTKVVILMTDGDNVNGEWWNPNNSRYTGLGYAWMERLGLDETSSASERAAVMNQRLAQLCTNMKAQGIVIYTVRVEVSSGSSSLLQACATEADNFYDVQNVADLDDAFDAIAGQVSRLRLSQ